MRVRAGGSLSRLAFERGFSAVVDGFRQKADEFFQWGLEREAKTLRCAAQLAEETFLAILDETLTLERAADESGYSADHLGRLIRDGTLPNAGADYAPRILRRDLPRKPGHGVPTTPTSGTVASRSEIARSVLHPGGLDA